MVRYHLFFSLRKHQQRFLLPRKRLKQTFKLNLVVVDDYRRGLPSRLAAQKCVNKVNHLHEDEEIIFQLANKREYFLFKLLLSRSRLFGP